MFWIIFYLASSGLIVLADFSSPINLTPKLTTWSVQYTPPTESRSDNSSSFPQIQFDDVKEWPQFNGDQPKHQSGRHKSAQDHKPTYSSMLPQNIQKPIEGHARSIQTSTSNRSELDKFISNLQPLHRARQEPFSWNQLNLPLIEFGGFRDIIPAPSVLLNSNNQPKLSKNHKGSWLKMRSKSRKWDEPIDSMKSRAFVNELVDSTAKEDYAPNLPFLFAESNRQATDPRGSRQLYEEDPVDYTFLDSIDSTNKYSASYQMSPAYYAAAHPVMHSGHHKLIKSSRKSLEKSLALPILVGIGTALISFLLLSNLFLSLPLLAMTLTQLINGNMMPNNQNYNIPNNNTPNNNQQNPANGQTTNGRRKRDLAELKLEQNFQSVLSNFENHL